MNKEFIFSRTFYFRDYKLLRLKEVPVEQNDCNRWVCGTSSGKKGYCHEYAVSDTLFKEKDNPASTT